MTTRQVHSKADIAKLRRHALAAQGLLQSQPFGRGLSGARKAIAHIGYVQIDTISVVERAHHHVLRSRVPNFEPKMTNKLLRDRSIFEYWSHAAAFLPMHDFRFSLPYKHAVKSGTKHWFRSRDKKLMMELYKRIEDEGPLRSRDIEDARGNAAGWWDWKPAKKALEQLYMQGDLMVSDRLGFQKSYDLPERVLPPGIDTSMPTPQEFAEHILEQQLRCHGFATAKGITYGRRNAALRSALKDLLKQQVDEHLLEVLQLPDGAQFFAPRGLLDRNTPRAMDRVRILSPFDNAVIQRERVNTLFGFDYQIECYVPEAKRVYGYFCLPITYRDQFIGRMDCKAQRKSKLLEIRNLHLDKHPFAEVELWPALTEAIADFAKFQDCESVAILKTAPAGAKATLERQLNPT